MLTEQDKAVITSNDFVDLIVEYNGNLNFFNTFPNAPFQPMNDRYAVVYLPASILNAQTISRYGYFVLPTCYGLVSTSVSSDISLEASGITRLRSNPVFSLRGEGVLIGIIDTGIDYTNPVFINEDGTSKIITIWDQTIESNQFPAGYLYGTEYSTENINQALRSANPFEVVPSRDENGHGTMLAGIAAGNEDQKNNFSGVVPAAKLVVVKLKPAKSALKNFFFIPENAVAYQENDIMWASQYIIEMARRAKQPLALCIGLGSSQGSHDGREKLSRLLAVGGDFPRIAITIAAGNEGNTRRHFFGTVDPSIGSSAVDLNVGENEIGFTMELWGMAPNTYSIDIRTPSGEYIPRIAEGLRVSRRITFVFEKTVLYVDYKMIEAVTGDQVIILRFSEPTPGNWHFQVYSHGDLEGSFHIWLPMNGFISNNTYFTEPDPYTTITSPGTSTSPITVTAYNPSATNMLYPAASRGYSRDGDIKPDIAAPGVNILAPTLNHGYGLMTGTSAAAAHTAGVTAIILEWGIVRNNYPGIDSIEVKKFLIRGAERNPALTYPNRDWGYGVLDLFNVFDILRANTVVR